MKNFLAVLVVILSTQVAAAASIVCTGENLSLTMDDLRNEESNEADAIYEVLTACEQDVFEGNLCFTGDIKEASKVLKVIGQELLEPAGEYSLKIKTQKTQIKYSVWDGPNEEVAAENVVKACQ
jgi:hypothetical protein